MKGMLRAVAARVYYSSTDALVHLRGKVLILLYHRVIPQHELQTTFVQPGMYVTTETFERHLEFYTDHFTLLSFQDLLGIWQEQSLDPARRYCAITFDDGWLDNHRYAYPLLRAYRAPATIFLPTDLTGSHEWLWSDRLGYFLHQPCFRGSTPVFRETVASLARRHPELSGANNHHGAHACDALIELAKALSDEARDDVLLRLSEVSGVRIPVDRRFLNWEEAREMSDHGIAFGSHTCTHAALTRIDSEQGEREIQRSLDALWRQRVNCVPVLSYPYGEYSEAAVAKTRGAGYQAAVTTQPGLEDGRPASLFRLRRIGLHEDVSRSVPLLTFHIARQTHAARATA